MRLGSGIRFEIVEHFDRVLARRRDPDGSVVARCAGWVSIEVWKAYQRRALTVFPVAESIARPRVLD